MLLLKPCCITGLIDNATKCASQVTPSSPLAPTTYGVARQTLSGERMSKHQIIPLSKCKRGAPQKEDKHLLLSTLQMKLCARTHPCLPPKDLERERTYNRTKQMILLLKAYALLTIVLDINTKNTPTHCSRQPEHRKCTIRWFSHMRGSLFRLASSSKLSDN